MAASPDRATLWASLIVLGALLFLPASCMVNAALKSPEDKAVAAAAERREDFERERSVEARLAVESKLRDPSSAEFEWVKIGDDGVVCGRVNANNGFGGKAGFTRFIFAGDDLTIEPASGFEGVGRTACG